VALFPLNGGKILQERRYDIDWLRVLAMMMVFLFHCARFFGGGGWHLKNPGEESLIATLFIGLLDLWIMPLFLLIPLVVIRIALAHLFQGQQHPWSHFLSFTIFFIIGYIIPADKRFTEGIKKVGWLCLALGIVGFAVEGTFILVLKYNYANLHHPGGEPFSLKYVIFNTTMSIAG